MPFDVFAVIRDRAFAGLRAPRPSVLVFADDDPRANFGHPCRYLLFDRDSGELQAELPARLPPWGARIPDNRSAVLRQETAGVISELVACAFGAG